MNLRDKIFRHAFYALALLVMTLALLSSAAFAQAPATQATPPPPAAPRAVKFPTPVERTLANGLRVVVVERHTTPLAAARLLVKTGGEADPAPLAGLADITASLLTKGTATRKAPEIAEQIEALGGSIESGARWDASQANIDAQASRLAPAMEILADVVRRPVFESEEIERLRQQYLDDTRVALGQPGAIARFVASRVIFGDDPYGHPLSGTLESVAQIKREDIVKFHETYYRPDNAVLVIGGDVTAADAFKLAEKLFGDWKKPAAAMPATPSRKASAGAKPRVVVIDKPDAGQAAVLVARVGINRADQDYFRGLVANSVLGGYSGRLNQEIRIKRGLSYGAGSSLEVRRDAGPFTATAQTKNESGAQVADLLLGELTRLANGDLPDAELTPRKSVLTGGFARDLETVGGLVGQVASLALYGLGFDEINTYVNSVQSITAADVKRFASARLASQDASVIVVGDAKKFLPALREKYPNVEVIPVAELNLNGGVLRQAAKAP
ncbi:MAG TPA: pitrilysin family protein [Pyrinomonadaceae bacterium]|jgi:zinc protease|nr:pitrilysin family protein [Pyrinomonadaceae bacterium]